MGQQGPWFTAENYIFSSSCSPELPMRNAQAIQGHAALNNPHQQKPTSKERTHELTTNYRISEGQNKG